MAKCNSRSAFWGMSRRLAVLVLCGATLFAQQAGIEGVAINPVTGQPLSGVHISLFAQREATTVAYGAVSDNNGRFSIGSLEPGAYNVRAERRGFVYNIPGSPLTLKAGQRLTGFRVEMNPRAVIAGRVLDDYGDPMPYVRISIESSTASSSVTADDRGEFRFTGAPGRYLVKAVPAMRLLMNMLQVQEIRTDGSAEPVYGDTYYPSAATADRASPLQVSAGGELTGIEIRMIRQKRLAISGVVSGFVPPSQFVRIELQSRTGSYRDGNILMAGPRATTPRADGTFSIVAIEPGTYRLAAIEVAGGARLHSSIREVTLESTDLTNVQIALDPAAELTGKVEIAGTPWPDGQRRLVLERASWSDMGFASTSSAELGKDGGFSIPNFLPGYFRVRVDPMPENGYVKSVQVNSLPPNDGFADLPHGGRGTVVKVTLGSDAAQISGTIRDHEGDALVNSLASVFLLIDLTTFTPENRVRLTPEGKYGFKGLRPGKYRIFVTDTNPAGEALKAMWMKAEEMDLLPNARLSKDLKLPAKETANAR